MVELEPFIAELADRLIDGFADRGECEFIADFAAPFTVIVVCGLLGVPESDHESLLEDVLGPHRDRGLGNTRVATPNDPFSFLHSRFTGYMEERRANPRDDVMTRVAITPFPDGSMPDIIDVVRMASLLFGAGTGTTTHFLAAALQLLGDRADLQQLLRDEPEQIPNFVEEMLRMESPIKGTFRLARVPMDVGDVEVPAGATVMLVNSGANRDPRQFESPNEFRMDRENARQNLTFGHGIHLCAGAALARAEARVAIERLLDRLDDITISESAHGPVGARRYEYTPSYQARALLNLDLGFTPADR
jgi:cytochrome P450